MFDQDQVLDLLTRYPALWLLVPVLAAFFIYRKYRRTKRRIGHINDSKSMFMLVVGFIAAAIVIGLILAYS